MEICPDIDSPWESSTIYIAPDNLYRKQILLVLYQNMSYDY